MATRRNEMCSIRATRTNKEGIVPFGEHAQREYRIADYEKIRRTNNLRAYIANT